MGIGLVWWGMSLRIQLGMNWILIGRVGPLIEVSKGIGWLGSQGGGA